jgi:Tfp pilus assembly protein PilN
MNSINLLDYKNKISKPPVAGKQKLLRRIAVGLLFSVSALSIIFFMLVQLSPLPELERQRKAVSASLATSDKEIAKLFLINERTKKIKKILDSRGSNEQIVTEFQAKLTSGTRIESLKLENKNLSVVVESKSLLELNKFMNELSKENNSYANVRLIELKASQENNNFVAAIAIEVI